MDGVYETQIKSPDKEQEDKQVKKSSDANRKRHIAGTNDDVSYRYKKGVRSVIKDGQVDTNGNVAEFRDHGLLGIGKKDFIYIEGLEAGVKAEVVEPDKNNPNGATKIHITKRNGQKDSIAKTGNFSLKFI